MTERPAEDPTRTVRTTERTPQRFEPGPDVPDKPTELSKTSWKFIAKRTVRGFSRDNCTDLAAALTYYSVLSLFPALLALVSVLGFVGQGDKGTDAVLDIVTDLSPGAADTVGEVMSELGTSGAGTVTLIVGLVGALWSASGYVGAFGRALNRIYGVDEGRPFYKLRPLMVLVTVIIVVLVALVAVGLVVSGPVARSIGSVIGLGGTAVTVWNIAKWPVMLLIVILIVALLYYATPNVRKPKFRWLSIGAAIAVLVWILASVGFGFYVANFGSYNKTYGSLAGVIIFLLWLWLTNLALLFGAELDAEMERGRQLQSGLPAEAAIQLPPRNTKASDKKQSKYDQDVREARELRTAAEARRAQQVQPTGHDPLAPASAQTLGDGPGASAPDEALEPRTELIGEPAPAHGATAVPPNVPAEQPGPPQAAAPGPPPRIAGTPRDPDALPPRSAGSRPDGTTPARDVPSSQQDPPESGGR